MKVALKAIILVIIICIAITFSIFFILNKPTNHIPVTGYEIEIKQGMNTYKLASLLKKEKIINSNKFFVLLVKMFHSNTNLKQGWFMIKPNSSTTDVIKQIYYGDFLTVTFMIPEGSSFAQTNQILVNNGIVTQQQIDDFLGESDYMETLGLQDFVFDKKYASPEGFLSPDTYTFTKGVSIETIYKGMISLFYKKMKEIYPKYDDLQRKDFYNKIIMASIIEREVKNHSESPIVAGVFYNRIKKPMMLQSCATIQYILGTPKEQLTEKDLKIKSPYNTYMNEGLPPTPICNPGYDALRASFYPANHNYYFFVVEDPILGTHKFSSKYGDHLKAKQNYKDIKGFK